MQVNVPKLKGSMVEHGFTQEALANAIGMSRSTLFRKLNNGGGDFTIGEMHEICAALSLTGEEAQEIFLP